MKRILILAIATTLGMTAVLAEDLAPMQVAFDDGAVEQPLTGAAGDAAVGREVFADRKLGNCLACHMNEDWSEQSFHGEVGPPLDGVAERLSAAELRGMVINSKMTFPDSIMPSFYVDDGYVRPLEDFEGESILTAQQVEDVVAYLQTLTYE